MTCSVPDLKGLFPLLDSQKDNEAHLQRSHHHLEHYKNHKILPWPFRVREPKNLSRQYMKSRHEGLFDSTLYKLLWLLNALVIYYPPEYSSIRQNDKN